jgi:hypothetical protein
MNDFARILMLVGLLTFVIGGLFYLLPRLGLPLGKLPGDIRIERGSLTCLVPIATSILFSVLLTIGLNLLIRFLNR